jgi:RNA-splicing ligase RtcB
LVVPNGVTDVNDGYRLERLDVSAAEIRSRARRIVDGLASCSALEEPLSRQRAVAILRTGAAAVADELEGIWQRGAVDVDDIHSIGPDAFSTLRHTFGTFGRYGHFVEVLEVSSVVSTRCPVNEGDVVLVIHCGAMEVSDIVYWQAYFNFAESAATLDLVSSEHFVAGMFGLPVSHPIAQRFVDASSAVTNAAYAWRASVAERVTAVMANVLGRTIARELLSDLPHNRLEVDDSQVLHAKGVQPLCARDERTRCAIVCGGLGIHSYLVVPPAIGGAEVCHGAAHLHALDGSGVGVENIEESLRSLELFGRVERAARLEPLLNFSGRPKPRLRYDLPGRQIVRDLIVADESLASHDQERR